jgi:hypothetical protein
MTVLKRALLLALTTMALSSLSFATILCSAPTAISAIIAAGGCAFGTNTFTNVSISTSTESPGTPFAAIDPSQVALQITGNPALNSIDVIVSNLTPSNWVVRNTQQFNLILTYTVTGGLPAYFAGVGDSFNGSATTCSAGTTPCVDGAPSGAGAISFDKTADSTTLPTLALGTTSQPPVAFGAGPLSTFNVTDNIQVHATNASATLTDATNSFVIPEPMTSVLLGSGLLAFGFLLRRKRR